MKNTTLLGFVALFLLCLSGISSRAVQAAEEGATRILVLGDSLTAGYGIAAEEAFPAQLQKSLRSAGHQVTVINAGVSGDTTAGGLSRLEWALADRPDMVIVELGGNDALRALAPGQTRENLDSILTRLRQAGVDILLTGMLAPRNLGSDYYSKFDQIYPELSNKHNIPLYPFFLQGVAGNPELNLRDGIHPNARGGWAIVANIMPYVEKVLGTIKSG